jgi:hypothetical protein
MLKKLPKLFLLLLLCHFSLALFQGCGDGKKGEDAWLSFQLAMNRFCGENAWKSSGHSYKNGVLTVENVSADIDLSGKNQGNASADKVSVAPLRADKIEVRDILPSKDMKELLSQDSWNGTGDLKIAEGAGIYSLASLKSVGDASFEFSLNYLGAEGLSLNAAEPTPLPGKAGFLKALKVKTYALEGLELDFKDPQPEVAFTFLLAQSGGESLNFKGPSLVGDQSLLDVFFSLGAGKLSWSGLNLKVTDKNNNLSELNVGESLVEKMDGIAKFGASVTKDMALTVRLDHEDFETLKLKLAAVNVLNYDGAEFIKESFARLNVDDFSSAAENYSEIYTEGLLSPTMLAEFFTYPYSFDSASFSGLETDIDGFVIGTDKAEYIGPVKRHVVPSYKISVENFYVKLVSAGLKPKMKERVEGLAEFFGRPDLRLDAAFNSKYDPVTGVVRYDTPKLELLGLASISGAVELAGLTQSLVDELAQIPIEKAERVLLLPGFSDFGFNELRVEFKGGKLADLILNHNAREAGLSRAAYLLDLIERGTEEVDSQMNPDDYPQGNEALKTALGDFLRNPDSVTLSAKPNKTLNSASFLTATLQGDKGGVNLFNSLNIELSVNGNSPVKVRLE